MDTLVKTCTKCGKSYPATTEYFHRSGGKLRPTCKSCHTFLITAARSGDRKSEHVANTKRWAQDRRQKVLSHYSKGVPRCACCGELGVVFLTLDHIENDGNLHRRGIGSGSGQLIAWIRKNEYPSGFQVLCRNCNWAKHVLGECPHTTNQSQYQISRERIQESLRQAG